MFDIKLVGDDKVLLEGRFDASRTALANTILDKLAVTTTIDMSRLEYISSAGLGALIAARQRLAGQGGKLVISGANHHVMHVMKLARLDLIFEFM
ncbi:MAG: STAS domain-containing protein [candidate division Zixibacteria bacterium]|nr:STAS domain-containing protein [candidate division Zixibacteria bacterium]